MHFSDDPQVHQIPFCRFMLLSAVSSKVDDRSLRDIMEMGFNREAARQALLDNNNNLEVAPTSCSPAQTRPKAAQTEQSRPPPRG